MSRFAFQLITLFTLLVFPVLPGLCECVEAAPQDHSCCHEEPANETPKHPCPDSIHLCVLNPSDVDLVTPTSSADSLEKDLAPVLLSTLSTVVYSAFAVKQPPPELFSSPYTQDLYLLVAPVRGPPIPTT